MGQNRINRLIEKKVRVLCPGSQYIADDVVEDAIAPGVVLHPGCRISGADTMIGPGCELGAEGPVTLKNCQLEADVSLKGGSFEESVFLRGSNMGSCAHIRPGCLLEEEAGGAHAVGLKQTVLMSYVTLGSLINFCDVLMSGGTDRGNHSEVGSSYIHFNFTPHGDKATPSLLGDVPRGVLLDSAPIFLGGQGGLVGPSRVGFGTVIPAGTVYRGDAIEENCVHSCDPVGERIEPYDMKTYKRVNRIVFNNLNYMGNIYALRSWYQVVRSPAMQKERFSAACLTGAIRVLDMILCERSKRMNQLVKKVEESVKILTQANGKKEYILEQEKFIHAWPGMEKEIAALVSGEAEPQTGLQEINKALQDDSEAAFDKKISLLSVPIRGIVVREMNALVNQFTSMIAD